MAVVVILIIASRELRIDGSGTFSTLTLCLPIQHTAFIFQYPPLFDSFKKSNKPKFVGFRRRITTNHLFVVILSRIIFSLSSRLYAPPAFRFSPIRRDIQGYRRKRRPYDL